MSDTAIHDWTRVEDGTWHALHLAWTGILYRQLNGGILPEPYYALPEPQAGFTIEEPDGGPDEVRRFQGDLLTLHDAGAATGRASNGAAAAAGDGDVGGVALADHPPRVRLATTLNVPEDPARRIAVRHASGDRTVALIELVSPGNRDGARKIESFCGKVEAAIRGGVHVLLIDLFPFTDLLPGGMHGEISARFGSTYEPPDGYPLACVSYRSARGEGTSFVEPLRAGDRPPTMPLFLTPGRYVEVPLADGYAEAYGPTPPKYKRLLENPGPA